MCVKCDKICVVVIDGCSIMTIHLHIQRVSEPQFHHNARSSLYSPDLAPCDFLMFPKCKMVMWGRHCNKVNAIKHETTRYLKSLTSEDFQVFNNGRKGEANVLLKNREYFKGYIGLTYPKFC